MVCGKWKIGDDTMGAVLMCGLVPHPPLLIPDVGGSERQRVEKTHSSMTRLAEEIVQLSPDTLIIISPHAPVYSDVLPVLYGDSLNGSFARFAAPHVSFKYKYDKDLASDIIYSCEQVDIPVIDITSSSSWRYGMSMKLDHGAMVPLYYLDKAGFDVPIVLIGLAMFSPEKLYTIGKAIQDAVLASSKNVCVIISGDLSHRLTIDAPAGFDPRGEVFDRELIRLLEAGDVLGILQLDDELVEAAGECGLRPIRMMLGMFDGFEMISHIYSYEGPFGVGYAVGKFLFGNEDETRRYENFAYGKKGCGTLGSHCEYSFPVRLARLAISEYVANGKRIQPPDDVPDVFKQKAGVFVSLKKFGRLRGCIGTIFPTCGSIAEEIIQNAISAATEDPRFLPVDEHEFEQLVCSVDVLQSPEPVSSMDELDTKKYGVIVRKGRHTGLLLPNLEGIDTVEEQVSIACQKAGLRPDEPDIKLERFEVIRYT
jgi:AmmeMemoRadiSam system protein A